MNDIWEDSTFSEKVNKVQLHC